MKRTIKQLLARLLHGVRHAILKRRSTPKVRFARYKIAQNRGERRVAERMLRRLGKKLETRAFKPALTASS